MVVENTSDRVEPEKVAVLMATFNGEKWIQEQVESILRQENVHLTLFVSDDCSTDRTVTILTEISSRDDRVVLLPTGLRFGSAGKNFYRLLCDVDVEDFDYIAFADQDDIWLPGKLGRHVELIRQFSYEAVSSNVTAFWENGKTMLIDKSQPLRTFDYLFEAAGPGCSYVMSKRLSLLVRALLKDPASLAQDVALHDWLSYAVCRAMGWEWHIDPEPSVLYRQHSANVLGASSGFWAKMNRFGKLKDGWYRTQVQTVLQVCNFLIKDPDYVRIARALHSSSYFERLCLIKYLSSFRRKLSDRISLGLAIFFAIF
jgi:rhamnosyltransferase